MAGKSWRAGFWGQDTVLAGTFWFFIRYIDTLVAIVFLFFFTTKLVKVFEESLTV